MRLFRRTIAIHEQWYNGLTRGRVFIFVLTFLKLTLQISPKVETWSVGWSIPCYKSWARNKQCQCLSFWSPETIIFLPLLPLNPVFPVSVPLVKMLWSVNNDPLLFTQKYKTIQSNPPQYLITLSSRSMMSLIHTTQCIVLVVISGKCTFNFPLQFLTLAKLNWVQD